MLPRNLNLSAKRGNFKRGLAAPFAVRKISSNRLCVTMTEAKACLKVWILTDDHGQVSDQAFIKLIIPTDLYIYLILSGFNSSRDPSRDGWIK